MKNMFKRTKAYLFIMLIFIAVLLQNTNMKIFAQENRSVQEPSAFDENSDKRVRLSAPDNDGRYYLTECEKPDEKSNVNLAGTGYDHALFNPKNNETGTTVPWYISLGGNEAMCVTFNGHASRTNQKHHYVMSDINSLRSNPYFEGGGDYPVEDYLKGVCYAYEMLTYPEQHVDKTYLDAGREELIRKTNPNMVRYSGKPVNYAVHQIITWRIASGSFNPDNFEYEHNLAKVVFGQMYPGSEWEDYGDVIVDFYDYYMLCAKEAASGNYKEKYSTTRVQYWIVQNLDEYTELSQWQDFITWEVSELPQVSGAKIIDIYKYGANTDILIPGAKYGVYSDTACTNKLGIFTSDDSGNFKIWAVEGIYYMRELSAPIGTLPDDAIYTLEIKDDTVSYTVKNEEIFNYLEVCKYEEKTGVIFTEEAKFDLYEYNSSTDSFLWMGELIFDKQGRYSVFSSENYTYHSINGAAVTTMKTDKLYYTPSNQGRFKIVESSAPKGWKRAEDKEFIMNTSVNGYAKRFRTYESGIIEQPYYCGVSLVKYDAFTKDKLSGADFIIQENIDGQWYEVGKLKEKIFTDENGTEYPIYQTSEDEIYSFHDRNGAVCQTESNKKYPLHRTVYNKGKLRLVETGAANKYYVGKWSREIDIEPEEDNVMISFSEKGYPAPENRGNANQVITSKYDAVTGEVIESPAVITVYEHIENLNEWLEVGKLRYDADRHQYTTAGVLYKPHQADGTQLSDLSDKICVPGYIYYTYANKGRYKLAETAPPANYEMGKPNQETSGVDVYEKEFTISEQDGEILDFSDMRNAPQDIGISSNVELVKYDAITRQKVKSGDAEFTIYEKIGDDWLYAGIMLYDEVNGQYTTKGMKLMLHNEDGTCVYTENSAAGLYYTSANKGIFRVAETKAPTDYVIGSRPYLKEFNLATDSKKGVITYNTTEEGAVNTGISGKIRLVKTDRITKEPLAGAIFILQEWSVNKNGWVDAGTLTDNLDGTYRTDICMIHTGKKEEVLEFSSMIYTTQNLGRFRVIEKEPPKGYINNNFISGEVCLSEKQEEFIFEHEQRIENTPIRVSVSKKSSALNTDIAGAKLIVKDSRGAIIDSWITDGREHIISAIPAGKYVLIEEYAPEGYVLTKNVDFEVKETGNVQRVEMYNEEVKGKVIIDKVDKNTKEVLAGAEFLLKDEEGNEIEILITDERGHAESELLDFGIYDKSGKYLGSKKYTLTEIKAPNGYKQINESYNVEFEYENDRTGIVERNMTIGNEKEPDVPTGDKTEISLFVMLLFAMAAMFCIGHFKMTVKDRTTQDEAMQDK